MNLYDGHRVEDHAAFLFDDVLPAVAGYADSKGVPTEVAAFAVLMAMAGVVVMGGIGRVEIIRALGEMHVPTVNAPEVPQ